ncbi:MAG TPA: CHAD domain-containing protein [Myxococcales bacterium LLY-WYZ-16_1]|nr:CHAD domain-containing protein [Myxococcales bacterium LLY-WYZ-16_1]
MTKPSTETSTDPRDLWDLRVRDLYGTALRKPKRHPDGPEGWVHDVRVACRRLEAAAALFAPVLPSAPRKRVEARAKGLRRRLGASREMDVILEELDGLAEALSVDPAALASLKKRHDKRRRKILSACLQRYDRQRLKRHRRKARALAPADSPPFSDLVATHLYACTEAAEDLYEPLSDPKAATLHHKLRIRIKRLRYALELSSEELAPQLDVSGPLKQLKKFQDALGRLNDAVDLEHFIARGGLDEAAVDAAGWLEATRKMREERHRFAVGLVGTNLPELLGRIRRSAGRTGQIALR